MLFAAFQSAMATHGLPGFDYDEEVAEADLLLDDPDTMIATADHVHQVMTHCLGVNTPEVHGQYYAGERVTIVSVSNLDGIPGIGMDGHTCEHRTRPQTDAEMARDAANLLVSEIDQSVANMRRTLRWD